MFTQSSANLISYIRKSFFDTVVAPKSLPCQTLPKPISIYVNYCTKNFVMAKFQTNILKEFSSTIISNETKFFAFKNFENLHRNAVI